MSSVCDFVDCIIAHLLWRRLGASFVEFTPVSYQILRTLKYVSLCIPPFAVLQEPAPLGGQARNLKRVWIKLNAIVSLRLLKTDITIAHIFDDCLDRTFQR